ncbi:MAG: DUF6789 family protein [Alphaproteobacteria bacterium]
MKFGYGIIAGFIATLVLSALMLVKSSMGMMPQLDAVAMLSGMGAEYSGLPQTPTVGWVLHFLVGTVLWGGLFALTAGVWPGRNYAVKGIAFSIVAWIAMMVIVMPMAGAGFFGLAMGVGAPIATLVLHIIFGAVLGVVYGRLAVREERPARA